MTEVYEFTKINAFTENPVDGTVSLTTDAGKKCSIKDEGPGKVDIRFIHRALTENNKLIFIAYESETGQCRFAAPFNRDHVRSIELVREPQSGLQITLVLRPSFLFLSSDHPRFGELKKLIESAQKQNQLIWVGTFPGDSKILDARLPNP